jgi:hypothetical protein
VVPALSIKAENEPWEEEPIKSRFPIATNFKMIGDGALTQRYINSLPEEKTRLVVDGQYLSGVDNLELSISRDFMEIATAPPYSRIPLLADYHLDCNGALCDLPAIARIFEEGNPVHVAIIPQGSYYLIEGNMLLTNLELPYDA